MVRISKKLCDVVSVSFVTFLVSRRIWRTTIPVVTFFFRSRFLLHSSTEAVLSHASVPSYRRTSCLRRYLRTFEQ